MSSGKRVLVTSWLVHESEPALEILRRAGHEVVMARNARPWGEEEILGKLRDVDAVIAGSDRYSARAIDAAGERLRIIVRVGVGYDTVDVAAATRRGVVVSTTPGTNDRAVADYAFGLILALARLISYNDRTMRAGRWVRVPGPDVNRKTLGIVGLGAIGRNVARRARGFEMRVLAYDVVRNDEFAAANQVDYTDLDTLFRESDFVTLHVPASPQTRGMVDEARLATMRPTAYLVNTARGDLVDMDALYRALKEQRIAGAGLDVFPQEPPPELPFAELDNVVLSPHVAGLSHEANAAAARQACESVLRVLAGGRPHYTVNPEVYG